MKISYLSGIFSGLIVCSVLSACDLDEKALLGLRPAETRSWPAYNNGSSSSATCREEVMAPEGQDNSLTGLCPSLSGLVKSMGYFEGSDKVVVGIGKTKNGNFPSVFNLSYGYYNASDWNAGHPALVYDCVERPSSGVIVQGDVKDFECTPRTKYRVSLKQLAKNDIKLRLETLVLDNKACGNHLAYVRRFEWVPCDQSTYTDPNSSSGYGGVTDYGSVKIDYATFNPFWIEEAFRGAGG